MRTSFELTIQAANFSEARLKAYEHIGAFIGCDPLDVPEKADVEIKVKTINLSEDSKSSKWSEAIDLYEVIIYGTLKQSVLRPL